MAWKIFSGLWLALFGILLTFIVGVIIWAVAGPTEAIIIFVVAFALFGVLPVYAARRGRRWRCGSCRQTFRAGLARCPHCGIGVRAPGAG